MQNSEHIWIVIFFWTFHPDLGQIFDIFDMQVDYTVYVWIQQKLISKQKY